MQHWCYAWPNEPAGSRILTSWTLVLLRARTVQVARDALPPYISKDTAESILFIGKAVRVLKQSASGRRPPGVPLFHPFLATLRR